MEVYILLYNFPDHRRDIVGVFTSLESAELRAATDLHRKVTWTKSTEAEVWYSDHQYEIELWLTNE